MYTEQFYLNVWYNWYRNLVNVELMTHFPTAGTINDVIFEFLVGYFIKSAEKIFWQKFSILRILVELM